MKTKKDSQEKLTINALSLRHRIDRRTLRKHLRDVSPDGMRDGLKLYTFKTVMAAMEAAHERAKDRTAPKLVASENLLRILTEKAVSDFARYLSPILRKTLDTFGEDAKMPPAYRDRLFLKTWTVLAHAQSWFVSGDGINRLLIDAGSPGLDELWRRLGFQDESHPPESLAIQVPDAVRKLAKAAGLDLGETFTPENIGDDAGENPAASEQKSGEGN